MWKMRCFTPFLLQNEQKMGLKQYFPGRAFLSAINMGKFGFFQK